MKNWEELFEWLLHFNENLELQIEKMGKYYYITFDKLYYRPISNKMLKKLNKIGVNIKK